MQPFSPLRRPRLCTGRRLAGLAAALVLAACASASGVVLPPPEEDPQAVRVFFATDRVDEGAGASERFGATPGPLVFGSMYVRIPEVHAVGAVEAPSFWDFGAAPDPIRHVSVLDPGAVLPEVEFLQAIAGAGAADGNLLVFIHGFNKTFTDAAQFLAQVAYDLDFDGPAVLYSWPSAGDVLGYPGDVVQARATTGHLAAVLSMLARGSGAARVYVLVHSLGHVPFLGAVGQMAIEPGWEERPAFQQVVMMATDMGFREFSNGIGAVLDLSGRVTLYASSGDRALAVGRSFYNDEQRVGEVMDGSVILIDGIDTIDAGPVDNTTVGHSYFRDNRAVLADLYQLFACDCGPDRRFGLRPVDTAAGRYWRFAR